jgi:transcriptional regulator with XRE-family HTH domain
MESAGWEICAQYNKVCYIVDVRSSAWPGLEVPEGPEHRFSIRGNDMDGIELKAARLAGGWTQVEAAKRLEVTQAYLSMVEGGKRLVPRGLARKAVRMLGLPPTALPLSDEGVVLRGGSDAVAKELVVLGYPGFAHLSRGKAAGGGRTRNPAEVLVNALNEPELDSRVVEGLPWLAAEYADMDWDWVVRNAKLRDLQNRVGFVVGVAHQFTTSHEYGGTVAASRERKLKEYAEVLERSRLVREDTLCHDSMTEVERKWLRANRPAEAAHWNLLTDLRAENLPHGKT